MALTPDTIAELNALAAEVFAAAYRGSPAETYAKSRGFHAETATHWRFGYAVPSATNLLDRLGAAGWPEGTLVEAGLCRPSERGTIDMFRDRLVFPILDRDGLRILGFGSRRLRDDDKAIPKYVNSPATPLFAKNETLYGWPNMAAIIAAGEAIVVEGNLDMIAVYQAGIHNVVAACGTAVTAEHLYALGEAGVRITLVLDSDPAGQAATRRTLLLDAAKHFDVGVAVMAGGKDPAELLAAPDGIAAFRALLASRVGRWDHLAAITLAPYVDTLESDVEARVAYKDAWTKLVAEHADDRATGERLLAPMAARLGLDGKALATEYLPADAPRAGEGNDELLLLALAEKWSERRHIADLLPLSSASRSMIDAWGDEPRLTARLRDRALREKSAAEQAFLLVARRDVAPALRTRISQTSAAVVAGTLTEAVGLASVAADRLLLASLNG
jgi:DNA primase catalytic core